MLSSNNLDTRSGYRHSKPVLGILYCNVPEGGIQDLVVARAHVTGITEEDLEALRAVYMMLWKLIGITITTLRERYGGRDQFCGILEHVCMWMVYGRDQLKLVLPSVEFFMLGRVVMMIFGKLKEGFAAAFEWRSWESAAIKADAGITRDMVGHPAHPPWLFCSAYSPLRYRYMLPPQVLACHRESIAMLNDDVSAVKGVYIREMSPVSLFVPSSVALSRLTMPSSLTELYGLHQAAGWGLQARRAHPLGSLPAVFL